MAGHSQDREDCAAQGNEVWVHRRLCLTCGHVACCDSGTPPLTTGHPVMRSYEPGETWRWCYLDRRLV